MPSSWIGAKGKKQVKRLTKQLEQKLQQLQIVQLEHSRLMFKHQLLVDCVDTLGLILQHRHQQEEQQLPSEQLACIAADSGWASAAEQLLLEELSQLPYGLQLQAPAKSTAADTHFDKEVDSGSSSGPCTSAASNSSSSGVSIHDTLAPAGQMLYGMRYVLSQPLFPNVETITLPELLAHYAQTIRELSLCLHQHTINQVQQEEQQTSLLRLKAIIWSHLRLVASMILQHRSELTTTLCVTNHETREQGNEQWVAERHRLAVQQAGLTPQQQQQIVQGHVVLGDVIRPVLQECRQLQQELGVGLESPDGSAKQTLLQHLSSSNKQQEKATRLLLLLRKANLIRMMMGSMVWGALTYRQLAQLAVHVSPYALAPALVVVATAEMMQQQQPAAEPQH